MPEPRLRKTAYHACEWVSILTEGIYSVYDFAYTVVLERFLSICVWCKYV